jgi:hypothetical protein
VAELQLEWEQELKKSPTTPELLPRVQQQVVGMGTAIPKTVEQMKMVLCYYCYCYLLYFFKIIRYFNVTALSTMNEMLHHHPALYRSAWTRDVLIKLKFSDNNISQMFVEHIAQQEAVKLKESNWSSLEIINEAKPWIERDIVSLLVCYL